MTMASGLQVALIMFAVIIVTRMAFGRRVRRSGWMGTPRAAFPPDPALEEELERQREHIEFLEDKLARMEERLEFTERLIAGRS